MDVAEAVRRAEEWAGASLGELLHAFSGCRRIHVAWLGLRARAAGLVLYWFLRQLTSLDVELVLGEAAAYHTAAYRGSGGVCLLLYVEEGAESSAVRVCDAYRFTGVESVTVLSPPLPAPVAARLRGQGVSLVDLPGWLEAVILSARLGLGLAERHGAGGVRVERLRGELGDLAGVAREAAERFSALRSIGEGDFIAYSPTMEPPALLAWRPGVTLLPLSAASALIASGRLRGARLYMLYTGVEDDLAREARFKASLSTPPLSLVEVRVNTDPLTAPIYASIAVLYGG